MTKHKKITFYYTGDDLIASQNLLITNLFEDKNKSSIIGKIIYITSIFEEKTSRTKNIFDLEQATIFLNDNKDTISFNVALYNKTIDNKFIPGSYKFQITSASGKYLGANGFINLDVLESGLRKLTIYIVNFNF